MPLTWNVAYYSGMSSTQDLRAAVDEGVPVGVVATLLDTLKLLRTLPRHLDAGGAVLFNKLDPWVESLNKKGLTKKD
jgi:hypothetical protein